MLVFCRYAILRVCNTSLPCELLLPQLLQACATCGAGLYFGSKLVSGHQDVCNDGIDIVTDIPQFMLSMSSWSCSLTNPCFAWC
jgi:hypothetical protein